MNWTDDRRNRALMFFAFPTLAECLTYLTALRIAHWRGTWLDENAPSVLCTLLAIAACNAALCAFERMGLGRGAVPVALARLTLLAAGMAALLLAASFLPCADKDVLDVGRLALDSAMLSFAVTAVSLLLHQASD